MLNPFHWPINSLTLFADNCDVIPCLLSLLAVSDKAGGRSRGLTCLGTRVELFIGPFCPAGFSSDTKKFSQDLKIDFRFCFVLLFFC